MPPPFPRLFSLLVCLATAVSASSFAQDLKKADQAPADHSGEAYVIEQDTERWSFENDGTGSRETYVRVRIQSEAGVARFGLVTLPYQKASETLDIDYVRVKKPDGSIIVTPLDELQDMPATVTREAPFYSDLHEKHLAVKGLNAGDILEIRSHWKSIKPLVPGQFWMSFNFPREEVFLDLKVQVSVPKDRATKVKSPGQPPVISEEGQRRVYTWSRTNFESKEPRKSELANQAIHGQFPAPDVQVSSFQSWEEVGRWYEGLQRDRVAPSAEIRAKAAELTRNAGDDAAKLKAIYKYVSTEFRYIGVSFGVGRYQSHAAAEVLSNQYGDCKDKHTLLAALLTAAGIPAYPVLISSSHAVDQDEPTPAQFNHVITAVPRGKDLLWLDATAEVAPFGYLLPALRGKPALVIYPDKPVFVKTPAELPFPSSWVFKISAKLDESGTLEGRVEQDIRGDLEIPVRSALRSLPRTQWKDVIQRLSYNTGFAGEVSEATASIPEATEAPLHLAYTYKRKDYPDWKNHRVVPPAPTMIVPPVEEEGKLPERLWLGAPGEFQSESRVELPKGYTPDLPQAADLKEEFAEYHSTYNLEGATLVAHYRLALKSEEISGPALEKYKAFAAKIQDDRDQYVFTSSGPMDSSQLGNVAFMKGIWNLPDSKDLKALAAEQEARAALQQNSAADGVNGVKQLKQAVTIDPKFTRAWIFLSWLYMVSRQKDAAIAALRKAVDSDPQQPLPYKFLAFTLTSLRRPAEAIAVWQDLAKVAPDDRDLASNLGPLLIAEKRYSDAIPYLETAAKIYPTQSAPLMGLATAYLSSGDVEKAVGAFDKAMTLEPGPGLKNDFAYQLALANKRLDDALRYAQAAVDEEEKASARVQLGNMSSEDLRHTPSLGAYWDTLGWVHFRLGNLKAAEGYLYAAWLLQQDPVTGYHLGQVYEAGQRKQEAAHIYHVVAGEPASGGEASESVEGAKNRLRHLPQVGTARRPGGFDNSSGQELSKDRTAILHKLGPKQASAEFFVLFAPGPKVEDTEFISGSRDLKSAGKALAQARFKVAFPENSSGRLVRRGILACYPLTGCSFVFLPTEAVTRVD